MRRVVGATFLVGAYVPLHRLLDPARAGPAGVATRASAEALWGLGLSGSLLVLVVAVVLAALFSRIVSAERLGAAIRSAADVLERPGAGVFAAAVGVIAMALALGVALLLYGALPTSVDEMSQLLHARAVADGRLGIPVPGAEAAWTIQNGLVTPRGWVSIYPPFHTLLLAMGLRLGAPWLVGPVAVGVATAAATLSFERLFGRRGVGRACGIVLAVAPFWLLIGGTHLSHTTAAACLALVLWTGLRARDGGVGWAIATGAAVGAAVCTRPWIGLVSSATLLTVLWWPSDSGGKAGRSAGRLGRLAATVAGGVPFAALLFWWNARLFGHPLRLGYAAMFGPAHGLGFHVDPWGNQYGLLEALAYTGADLVQLGAHLLETPFPVVALVGFGLLIRTRDEGTRVLLAWALATLAANALYWHHGVHMGPRMLYEAVPAWVGLVVSSAALLMSERVGPQPYRGVASWAVVLTLLGGAAFAPGFVRMTATDTDGRTLADLPTPAAGESALVFVHGSWSSRIAARLSTAGMRRDSVETALRRNDICAVDRYARWRATDPSVRPAAPPRLDLTALPGSPLGLEARELSPGNRVRVSPGAPQDSICVREARADRLGTVELELLLWQAPPLPGHDLIVARDLGPAANAAVREALDQRAYVYLAESQSGSPRLLEYEEGMELLWGGAAGAPVGGGR